MPFAIPEADFPDHPTYNNKRILVCGSGRCVWADMEHFLPEIRGGGIHIMAVNDVGMHIPFRVHHWFSNSPDELLRWVNARRPQYEHGSITHALKTARRKKDPKYLWPWKGHGTSSLNATYTAVRLGYKEIILCGVPLDDSGHYFDPHWVSTNFDNEVPLKNGLLKWWKDSMEYFDGNVKSMSGRTRELLGAPH